MKLEKVLLGKYRERDNYSLEEGINYLYTKKIDTSKMKLSEDVGHTHTVLATCFWKDEFLASIGKDRKIIVWNLRSGKINNISTVPAEILVDKKTIAGMRFISKEKLEVNFDGRKTTFSFEKEFSKVKISTEEDLKISNRFWVAKRYYRESDVFLSMSEDNGYLRVEKNRKFLYSVPIHARFQQKFQDSWCPVLEITPNQAGLVSVVAWKCHEIYIFNIG